MQYFELLKLLSETPGAPGHEFKIRNLIIEQVKPYADSIEIDSLGNLIVLKKGKNEAKTMIAAHMDEISFMVTHITDSGFAKFTPLGGFDPKTLVAQRVIVHGKKDLIGVLAAKPIHVMSDADKAKILQIEDFYIDFGLSGAEVKEIVSVGDVVTRERELITLGDCYCGKSLDNRIACLILIETLKKLETPATDVYAVFSVQEEIGIRGVQVATHYINPDFSFGLDTTIAFDTPDAKEYEKITQLGKGVAIKQMDSSVVCDYRMIQFMKQTAEKHQITWQPEILTKGGTDTAMLQRAGKNGSIAGCVSIPTRNIHTVVEMVHHQDVQGAIDLLTACLNEIDTYNFNWSEVK